MNVVRLRPAHSLDLKVVRVSFLEPHERNHWKATGHPGRSPSIDDREAARFFDSAIRALARASPHKTTPHQQSLSHASPVDPRRGDHSAARRRRMPFVGVVEITCGVLVIVGLLTRWAAVPLLIDMAVAIATTKWPMLHSQGFWAMAHEARTDWCMFLGALFLLIVGPGAWSIDAWVARHR